MLFRCSNEVATECLRVIGSDLLLSIFSALHILTTNSSSNSVRVLIRHLSSIEVSFHDMEESQKVMNFLETQIYTPGENPIVVADAMRVLVGFTLHTDGKVYLMEQSELIDKVVALTSTTKSARIKLQVSRFFQSLSLHWKNKSIMIQIPIIKTLLLLTKPNNHINTQINAIKTLRNLSVAQSKSYLVDFKGGHVLRVLLKAAANSKLEGVAVETLLSLICYKTSARIGMEDGLIEMLTSVAAQSNVLTNADKAAQSIRRLATHLSVSHQNYQAMFNSLISLSDASDDRVRYWISKAFLEQASLSSSSFFLVRTSDALKVLVKLCKDHKVEVRASAVEALRVLTTTHANLKWLVDTELLDALVINGEMTKTGNEERIVCRNAVLSLLNLAYGKSARKVAKHIGIAHCLSKYGVSDDDDDELKRAALHGLIILAPHM